jgi:hypothetical protein
MTALQFYNDISHISFVFVTGACRVGKTSLSNYLAQHPQIEFLDEPWEIMMFPFLLADNLHHNRLGAYFKAQLGELANEMMLYRRANLRFNDASSIWKSKTPHNVYERLMLMNSRAQVKDAFVQQKITILLALPETTPFIDFFFEHIPNLKIIHLTRNGLDVAKDIAHKGWFSDEQLLIPKNSQPYRLMRYQSTDYYLPWWVDSLDGEAFVTICDLERALWYWHYFHSSAIHQKNKLAPLYQRKLLQFDSAKLNDPALSSRTLQSFLEIHPMELLPNFTLSKHDNNIDSISWSASMPIDRRQDIETLLKSQQQVEVTC